MSFRLPSRRSVSAFLILCVLVSSAFAQQISQPEIPVAANIVIPQARGFNLRQPSASVQISEVKADIHISEQVATTKLSISLKNPSDRQQEAELLVPVPDGAVVRSFDFAGSSSETTAKLLPKGEAKAIYRSIVSRLRDPALLEFAGYNLIRSSVFPVSAKGNQEVRLIYENLLPADGDRVDYILPRSESFEASATPWTINVQVKTKKPLLTLYSPSHQISSERINEGQVKAVVSGDGKIEPGPFRLSYLAQSKDLTASLMAYPDPKIGGGYFLLLAGLPAGSAKDKEIKREVTLVMDRSGSMEGEKFEQARDAAMQIIEKLKEGESFNIIDYSIPSPN
jgi:Ca-activated chloride channel family protein